MLRFIKQNAVLSTGILLPVLLMAVFFVSVHLPKQMEAPPEYNLIFSAKVYDYNESHSYDIYYKIKDETIIADVTYRKGDKNNPTYYVEKLYSFDAVTNTLTEIRPDIVDQGNGLVLVNLPDLKDIKVTGGTTSPDGYVFKEIHYHNRGLVGDIFGSRRYYNTYMIFKNNSRYTITDTPHPRWNYTTASAIGWVKRGDLK